MNSGLVNKVEHSVRRRPSQLRAFVALSWYPLLAMSRNLSTMFFGFIFPIVFIAIFALIGRGFGGIELGLVDDRTSPVVEELSRLPGVTLVTGEPDDLERQLRRGDIEGLLTIDGNRVTLSINTANPQSQLAPLWLDNVVANLNLRLSGVTTPPVTMEVVAVAGRSQRFIDFALPGQIGFALLSTAIFGTVFGLIFLKKSLVLKRMFATPVRGLTILLGQGAARLILALAQTAVILIVGIVFFDFQLAHGVTTFLSMLCLSGFGLIVFLGFGLFIAGRTSSEEGAGPLTNLFTLPQFMLSGTFFPTDVFPAWLQPFAQNLPLSHLNTAMRQVATEGASLLAVAPHLLALVLWGVVAYALAMRTFRWF